MIQIKVIMEDGDYFFTKFYDTEEAARRYFVGKVFNKGIIEDDLVKCVDIEYIKDERL